MLSTKQKQQKAKTKTNKQRSKIPIESLSNSPLSYLKTTKQIKVVLKIFFFH
jgi:hypothetical protein